MPRPTEGCDCGADEIPGASCQFPECQLGDRKKREAAIIGRLITAGEAMVAFRESDQGLGWESFKAKDAEQNEEMKRAIRDVRELIE